MHSVVEYHVNPQAGIESAKFEGEFDASAGSSISRYSASA